MLGLLLGAALLCGCDDEYGSDPYDNWDDEDMYACTEEWRSLHPYGYNPVTGGYSAEEDEENGW